MRRIFLFALIASFILPLSGCWKCYDCTAQSIHGEEYQEVCGRKRDIQGLIQALETDTAGVGPWICE